MLIIGPMSSTLKWSPNDSMSSRVDSYVLRTFLLIPILLMTELNQEFSMFVPIDNNSAIVSTDDNEEKIVQLIRYSRIFVKHLMSGLNVSQRLEQLEPITSFWLRSEEN